MAHLIVVCSRHTPYAAFARGAADVAGGQPVDVEAALGRWFTTAEVTTGPPVVDYVRRRLLVAPREPWAGSLDAIAVYDRSGAVGRIATPVTLLAAGLDEVARPTVMAELAAAVPHARLRVVADWSHMSPFAHPQVFARALDSALGEPPVTL